MDLAPMVAMIERKNLQEDLQGVTIFAATWDATYRFAEVFALIIYFFNPSTGRRQKRLINLRLLRGSLTGPETCGVVLSGLLSVDLLPSNMVFSIFDRCAVNYSAHAIIQGVAPIGYGCVSHTTSHVGEHAELLLVKTIVKGLNIATHSIGARTLFQESTTR
jgi:hypothetical protein